MEHLPFPACLVSSSHDLLFSFCETYLSSISYYSCVFNGRILFLNFCSLKFPMTSCFGAYCNPTNFTGFCLKILQCHCAYYSVICLIRSFFPESCLDCSLFIPQHCNGTIYSFINVIEEKKNTESSANFNKTWALMDKQLKYISAIWSSNKAEENDIEVCFFVCYPESMKENKTLPSFQESLTSIKHKTRELKCRIKPVEIQKGHSFSETTKNEIKAELISSVNPQTCVNHSKISAVKSFAASEFTLEFSRSTFSDQSEGNDRLLIKLDSEGVRKFVEKYFPGRSHRLITVPDFDQIKSTKLYPIVGFFSSHPR